MLEERIRTGQFRGELALVRGDGTRFPAEVSSGMFRDRDGSLKTSIIFRDITERIQAYNLLDQRVAERTRELGALLEVGRNLASTLALGPLLNNILAELKTVVDYTGAGIAILKDGELELVGYQGPIPRHKMIGVHISLARDTGYQRVVGDREPVIIDDFWADVPWLQAAWVGWDGELIDYLHSVHSWLGVPLIAKGELIGVIRIDHVEPGHFTKRHAKQASHLPTRLPSRSKTPDSMSRHNAQLLSRNGSDCRANCTNQCRRPYMGSYWAHAPQSYCLSAMRRPRPIP